MEKIQLGITTPQLRKFNKLQPFQMSHKQLTEGNGIHTIELNMPSIDKKKLDSAIRRGKGFRFQKQHLEGGSILKKLKDFANKARKTAIKHIPKELVKQGIHSLVDTASMAIGHPELSGIGHSIVNGAVDNIYSGGKLKRFAKGSAEAKAWGEKMRSLRKSKKGGSLLGDINKALNPKTNGVSNAFNQVKSVVKPVIRPVITGAITAGIDGLTGSPVGSVLSPVISQGVNAGLNKANIGIGLKARTNKIMVRGGTLHTGVPIGILSCEARRRYVSGGSFLPLGN